MTTNQINQYFVVNKILMNWKSVAQKAFIETNYSLSPISTLN